MAGIFSLFMGILGIVIVIALLVIAAILVGIFITGFIGGIILLFTGNKLSKNTQKKVASRVCIGVGVVFLLLAGGSAGVIINFVTQIWG